MAASGSENGIRNLRPLHEAAKALEGFLEAGSGEFIAQKVLAEKLGMPVRFELEDEGSADDGSS